MTLLNCFRGECLFKRSRVFDIDFRKALSIGTVFDAPLAPDLFRTLSLELNDHTQTLLYLRGAIVAACRLFRSGRWRRGL